MPILYWFTVGDAKNVDGIAELGVVFLLFLIGLELSFHRLLTMRRLVFGLGGLQVLLTSAVIAGVAVAVGQKPAGCDYARRQPVAVLDGDRARALSNQERLTTSVGRASFSVLLAQDLAVIPILMFISILAGGPGGSRCSRASPPRCCRRRSRSSIIVAVRPRAVAAAVPAGRDGALAASCSSPRCCSSSSAPA